MELPSGVRLPYFDRLFEAREKGGDPTWSLFERFVHWGYWEDPGQATLDRIEFADAMERLNAEVLKAARLGDGQTLLDAGCGFGGTLDSIQRGRRGMRLTGLNIDPRQLAVAREAVRPMNGCELTFVEGDACALPFPDGHFDRVTAVECIFHFPSRARFLREAARVLKPGGIFALSDFVPPWTGVGGPVARWLEAKIGEGYGSQGKGWTEGSYEEMARAAGLEVALDRDITRNTLPTYPILIAAIRQGEAAGARPGMLGPTRLLDWVSRLGLVRYRVLAFCKPSPR